MNRFGSYKLRISWASVCIILTGLVLTGISNVASVGGRFVIFGVEIPLGFDSLEPYIIESLGRATYTIVPAIILLGGFIPLGDWLTTGGVFERYRALCVGLVFALLHGLFLSQLAVLPIMAASYRLLGSSFVLPFVTADINAIILGFQLLVWATVFGLVIKSNRGLTILFVYSLIEIGQVMTWGGEFLVYLGVYKLVTGTMTVIGQLLPGNQLPSDTISWTTLYTSFSLPLLVTAILLLTLGKVSKKVRLKCY
jgi:hypothetical protein